MRRDTSREVPSRNPYVVGIAVDGSPELPHARRAIPEDAQDVLQEALLAAARGIVRMFNLTAKERKVL